MVCSRDVSDYRSSRAHLPSRGVLRSSDAIHRQMTRWRRRGGVPYLTMPRVLFISWATSRWRAMKLKWVIINSMGYWVGRSPFETLQSSYDIIMIYTCVCLISGLFWGTRRCYLQPRRYYRRRRCRILRQQRFGQCYASLLAAIGRYPISRPGLWPHCLAHSVCHLSIISWNGQNGGAIYQEKWGAFEVYGMANFTQNIAFEVKAQSPR